MKLKYKKLGDYIVQKGKPNKDLINTNLLGISNNKCFVKAKTNLNGIDLSKYRIVERNQFAFNRATTRNGDRISIALREGETCIVSPSYRIFEVKDETILYPQYLMMWFRRPEFDRYARFKSHGSAHEFFDYEEMCDIELPIPSIEKQHEIVNEYNIVNGRILLHEQIIQRLQSAAQAIYKHWFLDFEFPITGEYAKSIDKPELEGRPYKASGGKMKYCEESEKDIPIQFTYEKLASIVDTQYGYTISASFEQKKSKLLRITDISSQYVDWSTVPYCDVNEDTINKYQLKEGDVVVARTGATVGYAKRINKQSPVALFASYLVRLTPKNVENQSLIGLSLLSSEFLSYIQLVAGGTGQPQASATLMTEFKLLVPTPQIAYKLDKVIKPLWDYSEKIEIEITHLRELSSMCLMKLSR